MIGSFVLKPQIPDSEPSQVPPPLIIQESGQHIDPLSEVLALLKPQSYSSGGFALRDGLAIHFPKHQGIKCYTMLAGQCWLVVDFENCYCMTGNPETTDPVTSQQNPIPFTNASNGSILQ